MGRSLNLSTKSVVASFSDAQRKREERFQERERQKQRLVDLTCAVVGVQAVMSGAKPELSKSTQEVLKSLSDKEAQVLRKRFGIEVKPPQEKLND